MGEVADEDVPNDLSGYADWALGKAGGWGWFQFKFTFCFMATVHAYLGLQTYILVFSTQDVGWRLRCPSGLSCEHQVGAAEAEHCSLVDVPGEARSLSAPLDESQRLCFDLAQNLLGPRISVVRLAQSRQRARRTAHAAWTNGLLLPASEEPRVHREVKVDMCDLPAGAVEWEKHQTSLVSNLGLVCGQKGKVPWLSTMYFIGFAIALPLGGMWSDWRGRKEAYTLGLLLMQAGAALSFCAPGYAAYALARFLLGAGAAVVVTTSFVWNSEMLGQEARSLMVLSTCASFAVGQTLLSLVAFVFPEWRHLSLAVFVLGLAPFGFHWCLLESPKWLAATGRADSAHQVFCSIAAANGNPPPAPPPAPKAVLNVVDDSRAKAGSLTQLCDKRLIVRFLLVSASWLIVAGAYYGLGLNAGNVDLSIHLANTINGLVQIPASAAGLYLVKISRKLAVVGGFLLAGICLLLGTAFRDIEALLTLYFVGTFGVAGCFSCIYLYTTELYPTSIRSQALSISSFFARVGAMVSPFIAHLGATSHSLPLMIFGIPCIVIGAAMVVLPETRGVVLPDSIDDLDVVAVPSSLAIKRKSLLKG